MTAKAVAVALVVPVVSVVGIILEAAGEVEVVF